MRHGRKDGRFHHAASLDAEQGKGVAMAEVHGNVGVEAAGRLGVRLVLPLGLCHLPAFILIGVVPVLLSTGVALLGG